ncbi:glycoside hydrolase 5 family protein [Nocardiopsis suaedae]|uniref:Glycosyl hydrolase n=1 Tax=Nocardiopsis suaedae TaxID=3018444 RepID=A0ABT4THK4_9ACTN|nr:glycosyl hydrolase [Nocardiopsis suaedae]MDA2803841.1 glycosyl hydrolase [Nocardiopsis suaedae]
MTRIRFGANYTPTRGWFHHWLDFDEGQVRADLESVAALGLDHVRVFALWPLFQPNRALIRPRAVAQLVRLAEIAGECGLDVAADALQGHLSSFDFLPAWTRTWHRRNLFTDPEVAEGTEAYLRTLAAALHERPNFLGMTLGNEFDQFSGDPHPDPDRVDPAGAGAWIERLLKACEDAAPGRMHLHSEYDAAWYRDHHPFTPAHAVGLGPATTVHSWVFNGTAQRHGPDGAATGHHAEYMVELATAWAADPRRPVWVQEVGAPAPYVPADAAPDFAEATVRNAVSSAATWGLTWWCSHDVDPSLADFPEHEYGLGLMTAGREPKPLGRRLARVVAELRERPPEPPGRRTAVRFDPGPDPLDAPRRAQFAPGGSVFEAWAHLAAEGVWAALVRADRVGADHLRERGITEVVDPHEVLGGTP